MDLEFRRQVKDALEHLYDTAYLQVHPLLSQIIETTDVAQLPRAQRLRGLLKDMVEALRPQEGSSHTSSQWRSYLALRYHYVQGMSMGQTENELGISLRQLQRELHEGVDALAELLWDMRARTTAAASPAGSASAELEELRRELAEWTLSRQPCDMQALLQDAISTLKPALDQRTCTAEVDIPADLPPVLADLVLTRQALFKVVRLLSEQSCSLLVRAAVRGRHVSVILLSQLSGIQATDLDWQTAELLIQQQGGTLTLESAAEGAQQVTQQVTQRVTLSMPSANQTRVLVIDDNPAIHRLFERFLAPQHYEVIHAESAQDALRLASDAHPDLITLDVMMPNADGWQALSALKQDPMTRAIPVVVCSVLREPELAFSLGAQAYLKKPLDRLELLATLARVQETGAPGRATPPPGPAEGQESQ